MKRTKEKRLLARRPLAIPIFFSKFFFRTNVLLRLAIWAAWIAGDRLTAGLCFAPSYTRCRKSLSAGSACATYAESPQQDGA